MNSINYTLWQSSSTFRAVLSVALIMLFNFIVLPVRSLPVSPVSEVGSSATRDLAVPLAGQSSYQVTVGSPTKSSVDYNITSSRPSAGGVLQVYGSGADDSFVPQGGGMPVMASGATQGGARQSYTGAAAKSYSPSMTMPSPWQRNKKTKAQRQNSTDIVNEDVAVMMRADDDDDDPFDPGGTGGFDHPGEIGKYPLGGEWILALFAFAIMLMRKRKTLRKN